MTKTKEVETKSMLRLFHHRWSLPVISELHSSRGAKFITLVNRLKVSRDSLIRTLKRLIEDGWIEKNPGYGHPMRPEYLLGPKGARIGAICMNLVDEIRQLELSKVGFNKWFLPILYAICDGCTRFTDLKAQFPSITPRALTQTLKSLTDQSMVTREVQSDQFPPLVEYKIATKSQTLCRLLHLFFDELEQLG